MNVRNDVVYYTLPSSDLQSWQAIDKVDQLLEEPFLPPHSRLSRLHSGAQRVSASPPCPACFPTAQHSHPHLQRASPSRGERYRSQDDLFTSCSLLLRLAAQDSTRLVPCHTSEQPQLLALDSCSTSARLRRLPTPISILDSLARGIAS